LVFCFISSRTRSNNKNKAHSINHNTRPFILEFIAGFLRHKDQLVHTKRRSKNSRNKLELMGLRRCAGNAIKAPYIIHHKK
jgi:hypothetical protein